MKIVLISPVPPPAGGIATWTRIYLDSAFAKRHDVRLVNTAVTGKRVQDMTQRSVLAELKRTYRIIKDLKAQLKQDDVNIVHMNCPCSKTGLLRDYICARIVKKHTSKLVVHFRCDTSFMVGTGWALTIFKRLCRTADQILVLNGISHDFIKKHTGLSSIYIPNFVNEKVLLQKEKFIKKEMHTILYAGHVTKAKGCDLILRAAQQMPQYTFILAGYISEEIKEMAIPVNVKLTGEMSRDAILELMQVCDVFLFPSHGEGFPNAVSEAMGMGMPIAATPVGAIPDMLESKGGILFPIDDLSSCMHALKVLTDTELRKNMSRWNQRKVQEYYQKDQVLQTIENIYQTIYE